MKNEAILFQAYPARIGAVEALLQAVNASNNNATQLRSAADVLDGAGPLYGRASTAAIYSAFAELLRCLALLVEWRKAIFDAEIEADRYIRGAKERYRQWQQEFNQVGSMAALISASQAIEKLSSVDEVGAVCGQVAQTPLPIGVFSNPESPVRRIGGDVIESEVREIPEELAIAFLRFQIDGQAAAETHFLTPHETHDLEIEVRVSRWPEHATHLVLTPISIELRDSCDFPTFEFLKPLGDAPFKFHGSRRAVIKIAQGFNSRPFEFKYAAAFQPDRAEQPVAVVGQRTLRIEGYDLARNPVTGYRAIDQKIIEFRDKMRAQPRIPGTDLANLLSLLKPICSLAGRSIQDALFKGVSNEAEFQTEMRNELRRDSIIGPELEEHAKAAGGITDLSFRGIRVELKFSKTTPLSVSDCDQYVEQTVAYTVGTGKRVGILCVLDNSPKRTAAFPAEEGIVMNSRATAEASVEIITILIQGTLARPSDLSR